MQIPAIGAAAEVSSAKETVPAEDNTVYGKSPFSGLLEGVMHELSGKNHKGETDQTEGEHSGRQVLLNAAMLCPTGPLILMPEGSPEDNPDGVRTETLCEVVSPETINGAGILSQNGMSPGDSGEASKEILPGEKPEGSVETRTVQNGNSLTKEDKGMTADNSRPSGQAKTPEWGNNTGKSADMPAKTDSIRLIETAEPTDAENTLQDAPGVKIKARETKEQKDSGFWPDRERGAPERETTGIKAEIVRYGNGAGSLRPEHLSETRQVSEGGAENPQSIKSAEAQTDIVSQVAEKMKVMLGDRRSEISIQLKPESLGRLKIRLTVTDGVLNGRIIVQNDETRGLIQANIAKLQENLEQQGIPVSKFNVNVGGDGGYGRQQFFRDNRHSYHGGQGTHPYRQDEKEEYPVWRGEGTIELLA